MTDERALKLARELAAQDAESHGAIQTAIIFREGGADDSISIRVALAAIKLTTKLAAEYAHAHVHFGVKAGLLHFKHLPSPPKGLDA